MITDELDRAPKGVRSYLKQLRKSKERSALSFVGRESLVAPEKCDSGSSEYKKVLISREVKTLGKTKANIKRISGGINKHFINELSILPLGSREFLEFIENNKALISFPEMPIDEIESSNKILMEYESKYRHRQVFGYSYRVNDLEKQLKSLSPTKGISMESYKNLTKNLNQIKYGLDPRRNHKRNRDSERTFYELEIEKRLRPIEAKIKNDRLFSKVENKIVQLVKNLEKNENLKPQNGKIIKGYKRVFKNLLEKLNYSRSSKVRFR